MMAIIKLGVTWLEVFTGHFIRVYKMLNMSVVELLQKWAEYSSKRADGGLGWKSSVLSAAGAAPSGGSYVSLLPYGLDESEIFCEVGIAVSKLPKIHKAVLEEEYLQIGLQVDKCKWLGISKDSYRKYLNAAHAGVEESLGKIVKQVA